MAELPAAASRLVLLLRRYCNQAADVGQQHGTMSLSVASVTTLSEGEERRGLAEMPDLWAACERLNDNRVAVAYGSRQPISSQSQQDRFLNLDRERDRPEDGIAR